MSDEGKTTLSDISRQRLAEVHPELRRRVENLADALIAEGIPIEVDTALRTAAQQDAIFAEGRTEPGKKVTNARGYQSNHVIGCAVDIAPDDTFTKRADWNPAHLDWQRIVALAPQYGLRDGKSWHDLPHLELIEIPTEPTQAIQELCRTEGVSAVWMELAIPTFGA
jgi:peptidoglycan L-alanyl-D-glutamate endopeptidase CwlK